MTREIKPGQKITLPVALKTLEILPNEDDNVRSFVISHVSTDRDGDTLEPNGCKFENFMKNPVVLWAHGYTSPPIGKALNLDIQSDRIVSKVKFAPTAFAQEIKALVDGGFVNGASVGFIPDKDGFVAKENGQGYTFKSWQLLEYSLVPVPNNPNAVREMLSAAKTKGITVATIEAELAKHADPETKSWSVGGARGLPMNEDKSWDAGAARKRLKDYAGDDWGKYGKGFIVHDSEKKEEVGGYKFPFADIVDGKLTAIKRGLIAARAVLNGARAGAQIGDAAESAKAFVDSYLGKQDDGKDDDGKILESLEEAWAEIDAYKAAFADAVMKGEIVVKRGAVLSGKNKEKLNRAIQHTQATMKHVKAVLSQWDKDPEDKQAGEEAGSAVTLDLLDREHLERSVEHCKACIAHLKELNPDSEPDEPTPHTEPGEEKDAGTPEPPEPGDDPTNPLEIPDTGTKPKPGKKPKKPDTVGNPAEADDGKSLIRIADSVPNGDDAKPHIDPDILVAAIEQIIGRRVNRIMGKVD